MSTQGDEDSATGHFHRRKTDPAPTEVDAIYNAEPVYGDPYRMSLPVPLIGRLHHRKGDFPEQEKHHKDGEDLAKEGSQEDRSEDDKNNPQKKKMSPKKKRMLIIIGVIVGILVLTGGLLLWLQARHYQDTDDAFIDGHVSQVSARVGGQVLSLNIVDNQHVEEGQLLLEIDPRDYTQQLVQTQAKRTEAVAQVALETANIHRSQANVEAAAADELQASRDLKRYRAVDQRAIAHQQLDAAIATEEKARAKFDAAQKSVDAAIAQKAAAESSVQQAEVAISNANLQLSYTKIVAPIAGHIARRTVETGNVVQPGVPLLAVVSDDLWVTANYKETQLMHMRVNQPVRISIDAFPNKIFNGHVDSFQRGTGSEFSVLPAENATGNYVKVVQRVPVKIVFDDVQERDKYPLSPGMSVDPRVTVR